MTTLNNARARVLSVVFANLVMALGLGASAMAQETLPWRDGQSPYRQSAPPAGSYEPPAPPRTAANDAYHPGGNGSSSPYPGDDAYRPGGGSAYDSGGAHRDSFSDPPQSNSYGEPYAPPGPNAQPYERSYGQAPPPSNGGYEQSEIVGAGHRFFGSISQGLASAVEYAFKSQGRPNGYILGEDAGGAFILGLRYGEGTLYTKDAGEHKVFWQGPSVGYDAGAEGSKTMVLVYNLRDPSEIYQRFGGVQGSAYVVGGVSVQFQKLNDVTLAVIRSGVGLRLGANVGYLKYTRSPTWNPL